MWYANDSKYLTFLQKELGALKGGHIIFQFPIGTSLFALKKKRIYVNISNWIENCMSTMKGLP